VELTAVAADVTTWNGTAVAAPTVAGVPKVELGNQAHGGAAATLALSSATINNAAGVGLAVTGTTGGVTINPRCYMAGMRESALDAPNYASGWLFNATIVGDYTGDGVNFWLDGGNPAGTFTPHIYHSYIDVNPVADTPGFYSGLSRGSGGEGGTMHADSELKFSIVMNRSNAYMVPSWHNNKDGSGNALAVPTQIGNAYYGGHQGFGASPTYRGWDGDLFGVLLPAALDPERYPTQTPEALILRDSGLGSAVEYDRDWQRRPKGYICRGPAVIGIPASGDRRTVMMLS
jgi:hypothetical protein